MKRDPLVSAVRALARCSCAEDLPDPTTDSIFGPKEAVSARLLVKGEGVICGLELLGPIFEEIGRGVRIRLRAEDGDRVPAGRIVAEIDGPARVILSGERTALNILQHLSGVATATACAVEATAGTRCRVLDTRKILPGFRLLDKYAVRTGGGTNHRMGLFDAILIKDNHIDRAGGLREAIDRVLAARKGKKKLPIIVEARTLSDVDEALSRPVAQILLDNMDLATTRKAVAKVAGRVKLEASGGMTPERIRKVARLGVDFVSIGAITHSAPALDLSLDVLPVGRRVRL
jgi:nicotinate-nucleotide pyrophosphorylase (carboxylating)